MSNMNLSLKAQKILYIILGISLFIGNIVLTGILGKQNTNIFIRIVPIILMVHCFSKAKEINNIQKGLPRGYTSPKERNIIIMTSVTILTILTLCALYYYIH